METAEKTIESTEEGGAVSVSPSTSLLCEAFEAGWDAALEGCADTYPNDGAWPVEKCFAKWVKTHNAGGDAPSGARSAE